MKTHATVRIGEYTIPLIGIPESATVQKCSVCGRGFHLSDIELDGKGQPLCQQCKEKGQKHERTTAH